MIIASLLEHDEIMAKIHERKVMTDFKIREFLAERHADDFTDSMTAGIFMSSAVQAVGKMMIIGFHFGGY